jgi:hypothetical protein
MECCPLYYEEYLNKDGTIDPLLFAEAMDRRILGRHPKENRAEVLKKIYSKLCKCPCHGNGSTIRH